MLAFVAQCLKHTEIWQAIRFSYFVSLFITPVYGTVQRVLSVKISNLMQWPLQCYIMGLYSWHLVGEPGDMQVDM